MHIWWATSFLWGVPVSDRAFQCTDPNLIWSTPRGTQSYDVSSYPAVFLIQKMEFLRVIIFYVIYIERDWFPQNHYNVQVANVEIRFKTPVGSPKSLSDAGGCSGAAALGRMFPWPIWRTSSSLAATVQNTHNVGFGLQHWSPPNFILSLLVTVQRSSEKRGWQKMVVGGGKILGAK